MEQKKKKISLDDLKTTETDTIQTTDAPKPEIVTPRNSSGVSADKIKAAASGKGPELVTNLADVAKEVKINTAPEKQTETYFNSLMDDAIERNKKDLLENVITPMKDKIAVANLEAESNAEEEEDPLAVATTMPAESAKKEVSNSGLDNINSAVEDDDELKELMAEIDGDSADQKPAVEDEDLSKLTEDEEKAYDDWEKKMLVSHQENVKSLLYPKINSIKDLRVSTAVISAGKALNRANKQAINTATVPLIHSGRCITLSSLTGGEIPLLNAQEYDSNMEAARSIFSIIYKHDVSPNKPINFDVWLKSICDWDIAQLYWGLYKATFENSNYISYTCPVCNNMFIHKHKIEDMLRVHPNSTEGTKERIDEIVNAGDNHVPSRLESKLAIISDSYAVGLRAPSVYSSTFETSALDDKFRRKYAQIINISSYIDTIYLISNGQAIPIDIKADSDNATKTVKLKIVTLYKIMQTLTSDESAALAGEIATINQHERDRFQYVIPGIQCEGTYGPVKDKTGIFMTGKKCDHKIAENLYSDARNRVEITPLDMLFMHRQLAQLSNFKLAF